MKKSITVLVAGFIFGWSVLIITTLNTPKGDCGDTFAGFGCALGQFQQEVYSNIIFITIAITIIMYILRSLKLRHVVVFSTLGAATTVSLLSVYSISYLFYNSLIGSFCYALLASLFFYASHLLFNKIIWKSKL